MQFIIIARTHTCLETHTCFEAVICILMSQQGDYYNYGKPSPDVAYFFTLEVPTVYSYYYSIYFSNILIVTVIMNKSSSNYIL